jgi:hypothetical protein
LIVLRPFTSKSPDFDSLRRECRFHGSGLDLGLKYPNPASLHASTESAALEKYQTRICQTNIYL